MSTTVSRFTLTIDGARSEDFLIEIDGALFKVDDFALVQNLLSPALLTFRMRKGPREDDAEPQFSACGSIIGKDVELSLLTENVERLSLKAEEEKTAEIAFRGIITGTQGSRSESEYVIDVEARSYEALLMDNATCKSFENKTLAEIVEDITEEYGSLSAPLIDPRYTEQLPYTVQYNETNYDFIARLARRFGEWLYNDGVKMVFGKIPEGESVTLGYPDKDIPIYNVDLRLRHTAFNHVASSYNSYKSSIKPGEEEMERKYNNLADCVFEAARERMTKTTVRNLHSGGFADSDSRDTLLKISTKTQGRGEKAGMLTYTGTTYCSRLRIGGKLIIQDNYLADDLAGNMSNVDQDEILITEIRHFFTADETYCNSFVGIPAVADYPPYSDTDIYAQCPSCRAKVVDNEDPACLGRIRVQFDWQAQLDASMMTPWLRLSQPYAGGGKGFSFIPEIGEEVMIDFEGGNAERPYVKGTLYNGVDNPDGNWVHDGNAANQIKAIRTRNGHTIEIHDEGDDGYIRIYDNGKENYILTFSTDRKLIKLESTGNIELYAKNDIIMHADHDIKASACNDIFIEADHDMQRTAANDIREHAGNDRATTIDRNDQEKIGQNQTLDVGANKKSKIKEKLEVEAHDITERAEQGFTEISTTHKLSASATAAIGAGTQIDIKAAKTKIN